MAKKRFKDFITHPTWQSLAAIATVLALLFGVITWAVSNGRTLFPNNVHVTATPPTSPTLIPTKTPTIIGVTPTPTMDSLSASTLIPDYQSVLNDPMSNQDNPSQWFVGTHGSATCYFSGGTYHITAPAGTSGGECNTQAANTSFTNFVYQIKMTILGGLDQQGGVGPSFCMSSALNGSWYRISFELGGYWTFGYLTGGFGNVQDKTLLSGVSHDFRTQPGQANYITVKVKDHKIDAQVNGNNLFSTTDTTLNGGKIGVELGPGTQNADVAFSNAMVWQLQ